MSPSSKQKTIAEQVLFTGKGLQTGDIGKVVCRPAEPDTGILFRRADIPDSPRLRVRDMLVVESFERRSAIGIGDASIQTVEHLMAALWGLEIDNILIEVYGEELPAMGGSAAEFMDLLREHGIVQYPVSKKFIKIIKPIEVSAGDASIALTPDEDFSVSYFIDYPCKSIGQEEFSIRLDPSTFEKEIAPARTFCLKKEAEALLKAGLGAGATLGNTLVMDDDGPIGNTLRFSNEPVRHKVLDIVGDLYLLGRPVKGKVQARKSGHRLNMMMVRKIYEEYLA